ARGCGGWGTATCRTTTAASRAPISARPSARTTTPVAARPHAPRPCRCRILRGRLDRRGSALVMVMGGSGGGLRHTPRKSHWEDFLPCCFREKAHALHASCCREFPGGGFPVLVGGRHCWQDRGPDSGGCAGGQPRDPRLPQARGDRGGGQRAAEEAEGATQCCGEAAGRAGQRVQEGRA